MKKITLVTASATCNVAAGAPAQHRAPAAERPLPPAHSHTGELTCPTTPQRHCSSLARSTTAIVEPRHRMCRAARCHRSCLAVGDGRACVVHEDVLVLDLSHVELLGEKSVGEQLLQVLQLFVVAGRQTLDHLQPASLGGPLGLQSKVKRRAHPARLSPLRARLWSDEGCNPATWKLYVHVAAAHQRTVTTERCSRRDWGRCPCAWDGVTRAPRGRGRRSRTVASSLTREDCTRPPRWRAIVFFSREPPALYFLVVSHQR